MTDPEAQTILATLISDHSALTALIANPTIRETSEHGHHLREQFVIGTVQHFVAEEQYLYPTQQRYVPHSAATVHTRIETDRETEKLLKSFEHSDLSDLNELVDNLAMRLENHVTEQQATLFPELAAACDEATLNHLGEQARGAEALAPTRPRPGATGATPIGKFAALVEGFVDHVRDAHTKRGLQEPDIE